MGDHFGEQLVSLMVSWLALVHQNPFQACFFLKTCFSHSTLSRSIFISSAVAFGVLGIICI